LLGTSPLTTGLYKEVIITINGMRVE
jgi:hypothetical protein